MLRKSCARFPKLKIAKTKAEQESALAACDFFLHGSGPGLVGRKETALAQKAGKPYGFGGITLNDQEIKAKSLKSDALMSKDSIQPFLNPLALIPPKSYATSFDQSSSDKQSTTKTNCFASKSRRN